MPIDQDGNITTTPSIDVKTLHDVIQDDGKDVIALTVGGMARTPKDTGDGIDLGGGGSYTLPAAAANTLGGVKKGAAVAVATEETLLAQFNALLASLKAGGSIG